MSHSEGRLTPMLAQYRSIKARFPDAIVLFRLGDFYETFEADAKTAARELELVLTSRAFAKGVRLPMAGVPHHHLQPHLARLIEQGYKVALVEQLEDPKKVKRLVRRDVIRVITPGTVVEDALLRAKDGNYLAAITRHIETRRADLRHSDERQNREIGSAAETIFGLAVADISTGEFATTQLQGGDATARLFDELQRIQASEYVLPQSLAAEREFLSRLQAVRPARISFLDDRHCSESTARRELCAFFGTPTLDPFGCANLPLATAAAGTALHYLKTNQPQAEESTPLAHLHLWTYSLADYMTLDSATRRNLELTSSLQYDGSTRAFPGNSTRSLFAVLDHTLTAMGARMLRRWIQQPLLDLARIQERLDAVEELHGDAFLRDDLRKLLDGLYDVERLVGRIAFGAANARDMIALKRVLMRLPRIKEKLTVAHCAKLRELGMQLDDLPDIAELIERAVREDPPIFVKEGGLIKPGYDPTLDELHANVAAGQAWLGELEEKEKQRTGIKNLRVRYNEVFGFFIEVPRSQEHLIPKHYERRATISHAERYVTPELKTKEAHILAAQDRVKELEYDLFIQVRRQVAQHSARLKASAAILAQVDSVAALAESAARYGYTKPLVDDGDGIEILEGRHPVVERFLGEGETFVPNDVHLDTASRRVIILTGPNMSGKSVFIRQVALIVLMAQMGSFVPASFAHIGLADRIFTRVGASDDIAQGRSTFLVEMSEASQILRHATARSLIVLDEVGRGTATFDGISLAWAIAEEIHNVVRAKTLFATHYHELTQLESADSVGSVSGDHAIRNYTMAVKEEGNEVIFLRQIIPGGAEKSFGIHVARLAGLPERVIQRAEHVLQGLEANRGAPEAALTTRPTLIAPEPASPSQAALEHREHLLYGASAEVWRQVLGEIAGVDIANMTPIQALNLLNEIQLLIKT